MTEALEKNGGAQRPGASEDQRPSPVVIAIDGPAGSGKSTVARRLAARLGFFLLDSGALYRVMALHLLRTGIASDGEPVPESALDSLELQIEPQVGTMRLFLFGEDVTDLIRRDELGVAASRFSVRPEVRRALMGFQRWAGSKWHLVAEGRDMGTVVFPQAAIKFFLTADLEERAKRRYLELVERGDQPDPEGIRSEMRARDLRDESRAESPLRKAEDAILIDTTAVGVEDVVESLVKLIEQKIGPARVARGPG